MSVETKGIVEDIFFCAEIGGCAEIKNVQWLLYLPHPAVGGVSGVGGGEQPDPAEGSDRQA